MKIKSIKLENIKCFSKLEINNLEKKQLIILAGENGSGKSTVFDALNVIFSAIVHNSIGSYSVDELLKNGEEKGFVKAEVLLNDTEMKISNSNSSILNVNVNLERGKYQSVTFSAGSADIHALRDNAINKRYHREIYDKDKNIQNLGVYIHRSPYRYEEVSDFNEPQRNLLNFNQDREYINQKAQTQSSRWQIVLSYFLQLDRIIKAKYFEVNSENINSSLDDLQKSQNDFNDLIKDFNYLLGNKKFHKIEETTSEKTFFWITKDDGARIEFKQLSSGEKEALFLFSDIRRQKPLNSVISVDEPELHLHYNLQRKLIDRFLDIGRDNQVFLATHSLAIVKEAEENEGSSIYYFDGNNNYKEVESRADFLELYKILANDLANVLASKCVVFVEGEDADKDAKIYGKLFNKDKINFVPSQDCKKVSSAAWLALHLVSNQATPQNLFAIIDGDGRNKQEKIEREKVFKGHLLILDKYSIENYFFDFALWEKINNDKRKKICKKFLEAEFRDFVRNNLNTEDNINKSVEKIFKSRKSNGVNTEDKDSIKNKLKESLNDNSFIDLFPMKEFLGEIISKLFIFNKEDFKNCIVDLMVKNDNRPKELEVFIIKVKGKRHNNKNNMK